MNVDDRLSAVIRVAPEATSFQMVQQNHHRYVDLEILEMFYLYHIVNLKRIVGGGEVKFGFVVYEFDARNAVHDSADLEKDMAVVDR